MIEDAWWKAASYGDCDWNEFVKIQLRSYKEKCRKKPKHCEVMNFELRCYRCYCKVVRKNHNEILPFHKYHFDWSRN